MTRPTRDDKVAHFRRFPENWMRFYTPEELPIQVRMLWIIISNHQWSHEWAFPSQLRLAAEAGISERQVRRWIRWMEDKGLLITKPRQGSNGKSARGVNNYQVVEPLDVDDRKDIDHRRRNGLPAIKDEEEERGESYGIITDPEI